MSKMTLKETRHSYNLSQQEASKTIGVPLRTFRRYESNENYGSVYKRESFIKVLEERYEITEEKGLLDINTIKNKLTILFNGEYKGLISFCYLFGSYAKGYANATSDIDLCICSSLTSIKAAGLAENIRKVLHKNIDLVRFDSLKDNFELAKEIMGDGIKIYG